MRTIVINESTTIKIEALRLKQIKALSEKGFTISSASIRSVLDSDWDKFIAELVKAYCKDETSARVDQVLAALDDLTVGDYRKVCRDMIAETWGLKEEEKNS